MYFRDITLDEHSLSNLPGITVARSVTKGPNQNTGDINHILWCEGLALLGDHR